jgi:trehalose 6-phosphate phosphatase
MEEESMTKTPDNDTGLPISLADGALASLAPPASSAYFLDVDGTLLDIRPQPGDVIADPALQQLLLALHDKAGGALALVSGRTIEDLDRIFAPLRLPAAGTHGAKLRFGDGTTIEAQGELLRAASGIIEAFVVTHPGLLFEDKGAALTVHFRHAPELRSEVLALLSSCTIENDLVVLEGKMVAELKLAQFNKGTAVGTFMNLAAFSKRRPVFIGDDVTDEYGFDIVNKMSGLSIRIDRAANNVSKAHYRLGEPAALRAQLEVLVANS